MPRAFVIPTVAAALAAPAWRSTHRAGMRIVASSVATRIVARFATVADQGEAVTRLPAVETAAGGVEGGLALTVLGPSPRVTSVAHVSERRSRTRYDGC